jgi:hypothetical protein
MPMTREQLLVEVEDVIRTMPPRPTIRHETPENLAWLGRVSAVIESWDKSKGIVLLPNLLDRFYGINARDAIEGFRKLVTLLHQAQNDLRMETSGPVSVAVSHGSVFEYFDEIRKIIELAKQDILFVDPYLDAEFVSRYLVQAANGVAIRLLTREKMASLLPAVDALIQQSKAHIEVRSAPAFHDRYIFIDKVSCYQSGASFKDGAKSAPTTLTQIVDAFQAMSQTYEDMWNKAKVER